MKRLEAAQKLPITEPLSLVTNNQGHPTKKKGGEGLECSFLLFRIVLWSFNEKLVRVNTI